MNVMNVTVITYTVVTCKIKHLQNICKNVLEPREVDGSSRGSKTFLQRFILRVTTAYLQAVFDRAKTVLQHFCKCFILHEARS